MIKPICFFADENIQKFLIKWLKEKDFDISDILSENLQGLDDEAIIEKAFKEKRVIITQDSDFGKIIFTKKVKFYSVIFLKPGHHQEDFHIPTMKIILDQFLNKITEGSIIIGVRKGEDIKIRFRFFSPNT